MIVQSFRGNRTIKFLLMPKFHRGFLLTFAYYEENTLIMEKLSCMFSYRKPHIRAAINSQKSY